MQNEDYTEILEEYKREQVPVVLTAVEAMDILGVGKNTMYRLLTICSRIRSNRHLSIEFQQVSGIFVYTKQDVL